jgi:predicted metalloprotease
MKLGIGGFLLLLVLSLLFKKNLFTLLDTGTGTGAAVGEGTTGPGEPPPTSPEEEKLIHFVSFVLDDAQQFWQEELGRQGVAYSKAKLDVFTDAVSSGCGGASSQTGPFYCPADRKVYIDLGFYRELDSRFGAPGDFAQAYVIAHELGHHVQHLLGIDEKVRSAQQADPRRENELSIRLELQADCYAGLWGHSTSRRDLLEGGDVEEGLGAAAAVGDDRIQKMATGTVQPEKWTHGSSEMRTVWFRRGFDSGRFDSCDPFSR